MNEEHVVPKMVREVRLLCFCLGRKRREIIIFLASKLPVQSLSLSATLEGGTIIMEMEIKLMLLVFTSIDPVWRRIQCWLAAQFSCPGTSDVGHHGVGDGGGE